MRYAHYQDKAIHHFSMVVRNSNRRSHVRRARWNLAATQSTTHTFETGWTDRLVVYHGSQVRCLRSVGHRRNFGARKDAAEVLLEVEASELGRERRHVLDNMHFVTLYSLQTPPPPGSDGGEMGCGR
jgi:hypothetical protein